MTRPTESDYTSHVSYCRELEKYTDELEAVLRECREALLRAYVNCPLVLKIDKVLK